MCIVFIVRLHCYCCCYCGGRCCCRCSNAQLLHYYCAILGIFFGATISITIEQCWCNCIEIAATYKAYKWTVSIVAFMESFSRGRLKQNSNNHIFFWISFFLCLFSGTSTRKPRLNSALVAQQAGASGVPNGTNTANPKPPKMSRSKTKHKKYPARLTNVDRSTAQTREVTVNSVTVVITEYKPKQMTSTTSRRESSEQSYSESNDSRS